FRGAGPPAAWVIEPAPGSVVISNTTELAQFAAIAMSPCDSPLLASIVSAEVDAAIAAVRAIGLPVTVRTVITSVPASGDGTRALMLPSSAGDHEVPIAWKASSPLEYAYWNPAALSLLD